MRRIRGSWRPGARAPRDRRGIAPERRAARRRVGGAATGSASSAAPRACAVRDAHGRPPRAPHLGSARPNSQGGARCRRRVRGSSLLPPSRSRSALELCALMVNLRAGGVREGGSTITQQLARGLFLGSQRTWDRKLREMVLAVELEWLLSKDQILEMYLNLVYWGRSDEGGRGRHRRSRALYFDRPVDGSSTARGGAAGRPDSRAQPQLPFRDPRAALIRRNKVLGDMVEAGFLNAATAVHCAPAAARGSAAGPRRPNTSRPTPATSATGWGRATSGFRPRALEHWGLAIFTTLDPVWQIDAERALRAGIEAQERWSGRAGPPLEGAFVALDPGSGCVRRWWAGAIPRPGLQPRLPGAPPTRFRDQASGLRHRARTECAAFTPATTAAGSAPRVRHGRRPCGHPRTTKRISPERDDREGARALAQRRHRQSWSRPSAPGTWRARPCVLASTGLKPVPSIGLGTTEVTLLDLTEAYACFPMADGSCWATPVRAALDGRGQTLVAAPAERRRAIPREIAALMTGLLEDVVIFGVSNPLRSTYGFSRWGRRQDRNHQQLQGCMVHRVHTRCRGEHVGGLRRTAEPGPAGGQTALPVWAGIVGPMLTGFPKRPFAGSELLELQWIDPWSGGLAPLRLLQADARARSCAARRPRRYCDRDHAADWAACYARQLSDSLGTEEAWPDSAP